MKLFHNSNYVVNEISFNIYYLYMNSLYIRKRKSCCSVNWNFCNMIYINNGMHVWYGSIVAKAFKIMSHGLYVGYIRLLAASPVLKFMYVFHKVSSLNWNCGPILHRVMYKRRCNWDFGIILKSIWSNLNVMCSIFDM